MISRRLERPAKTNSIRSGRWVETVHGERPFNEQGFRLRSSMRPFYSSAVRIQASSADPELELAYVKVLYLVTKYGNPFQ